MTHNNSRYSGKPDKNTVFGRLRGHSTKAAIAICYKMKYAIATKQRFGIEQEDMPMNVFSVNVRAIRKIIAQEMAHGGAAQALFATRLLDRIQLLRWRRGCPHENIQKKMAG